MSSPTHTAWLLIALAAACSPLHAQTQRGGGGSSGEAQKIMQQYQQLAGEKTALQTQIIQLRKDLDATKSELASTKKERDMLKGRSGAAAGAAAQLAAFKESSDKAAEVSKQRMTELVARFRTTATNLKEAETDRTHLQNDLRVRNEAYDKCAADNLTLFEINDNLLDRYEHVGPFTKVSAVEPFTRITRSRIENLVDEYRARALELRTKAQATATPAPVN